MTDSVDEASLTLLMVELLEWISRTRRTYEQAMAAWRSSCPRFTIWEDALAMGLIEVMDWNEDSPSEVRLTMKGNAAVQRYREMKRF